MRDTTIMRSIKLIPVVGLVSVSLAGIGVYPRPALAAALAEQEENANSDRANALKMRQQAEEMFFQEDFDAAIARFEQAHALDPDPTDLFNIGRIYEQQGKLEPALEHYEDFAELPGLSLEERAAAAERIKVLRVLVAKGDVGGTTPRLPTSSIDLRTADDGSLGARPVDKPRGRSMVVSGSTLLAVGAAAALAGGVGFGLAARRRADQVKDLANGSNPGRLTLAEAEAIDATGRDFSTLQITFIAAGGAIALAGAALLTAGLVQNKRARLAAITPTIDSKMVALQGVWRF